MPIPKLKSITFEDLRHAAGVATYFVYRAPPGEEQEEFAHLARLLRQYAELAGLYQDLDDEQRLALLSGSTSPKARA
jgi:hypothetical protein